MTKKTGAANAYRQPTRDLKNQPGRSKTGQVDTLLVIIHEITIYDKILDFTIQFRGNSAHWFYERRRLCYLSLLPRRKQLKGP